MYRDEDEDILIRQIRRFAEALGALFREGSPSSYDGSAGQRAGRSSEEEVTPEGFEPSLPG